MAVTGRSNHFPKAANGLPIGTRRLNQLELELGADDYTSTANCSSAS
jgi:hypothetical protein